MRFLPWERQGDAPGLPQSHATVLCPGTSSWHLSRAPTTSHHFFINPEGSTTFIRCPSGTCSKHNGTLNELEIQSLHQPARGLGAVAACAWLSGDGCMVLPTHTATVPREAGTGWHGKPSEQGEVWGMQGAFEGKMVPAITHWTCFQDPGSPGISLEQHLAPL